MPGFIYTIKYITMKNVFALLLILAVGLNTATAQKLKPYTIGAKTTGTVSSVKATVKSALESNGLTVVGQYRPANDANRWVIAITSPELKSAVRKVGGTTGFALALRVGITKEGSNIIVSYTTPAYWGNAYFQKNFGKVKSLYNQVAGKLKTAMSAVGGGGGTMYGSAKGMTASDLQGYHYMFGMPYFEDNIKLNSFGSYSAAVAKIDGNLSRGVKNLVKVYSIALPDKNLKLYGIGLRGSSGESAFLPTIDYGNPKHTTFLPYEMLVYNGDVYMLHGRYRIALSFPDLGMGTFMKIVSTPGNIEDLLKSATK
ncbi:MAG TPA: hypothetical protein ENJ45_06040 [Phaeodactylibacter sp.]|nr:hypothetical protein [Phaeodactylibacter sp.]